MKIYIKSIMLLLLSVFLCFGISACNDEEENKETEGKTEDSKTEVLEQTGEYIFKDNSSDYVIVIPENAEEKEILAKDELINYFKKATGYTLKSITDRDLEYDSSSKCIFAVW